MKGHHGSSGVNDRDRSGRDRSADLPDGLFESLVRATGELSQQFAVEVEMAPEPLRDREVCVAIGHILQDLRGDELREHDLPNYDACWAGIVKAVCEIWNLGWF